MRIVLATFVLVVAASAAFATTMAPGDVAAATPWTVCCILPSSPSASLYSNALLLKTIIPDHSLVAFGPNGHLFGAHATITEYDASLAVVRTIPPPAGTLFALAIAQNGDLYTLTSGFTVNVLSPTGTVKQTFALPFSAGSRAMSPSFDLAPDQCTIFYVDTASNGRRFNACTGQALANLPGSVDAVRAFGDGGYLVARVAPYSMTAVDAYDASDHLLRSYSLQLTQTSALAFDPDPAYFWAGTLGGLTRVRLSDGMKVANGGSSPYSMAVNGEQRPLSAAAAVQDIPALSPPLLAALGVALIALACHRLGR